MLSFALIVFRETLEISLIIGILLAATHGLEGRRRWLALGSAAGILGSIGVAYFADVISSALEGFGQEVFNAVILLLAAALIASTVLWMKLHSKSICVKMRNLGGEIIEGRQPTSILAIATMLTILRDGSEIALLSQGILVSGQSAWSLVFGGVLGLIGGALIGLAVYFGIIKSATRHIFTATSLMLVLLAAGMVSQAMGLLSSADIIPTIVYPLWDTSSLLADGSFLGQTLHVLIGYTARPSAVQCIAYLMTLAAMIWLTRITSSSRQSGLRTSVLVVTAGILASFVPGRANAIDKIYSPIVHRGEFEFETRGTFDSDHRDDKDKAYQQKFSIGYGVTDRFAAEILGEIEREPNEETEFEAWELESRYQLFEQGEYFLDSGLYFAGEWKPEDDDYGIEARLLLEKSVNRFVHTANLFFEREVFEDSGDENIPEEAGVSWVSQYKLQKEFQPGLEAHFNIEDLDSTHGINHEGLSVGPSIWGALDKSIKYELAGLFGVTKESPDFVVRFLLEFEFPLV